MKPLIALLFVLGLMPLVAFAQIGDLAPATSPGQCTNLHYNMGYRSSDGQTGGEVSLLQDFLYPTYLSSEPSGFFGRATVTAVQQFQSQNGLSPSGYVGQYTRAKIRDLTCGGGGASLPEVPTINSIQSKAANPGEVYAGETAYVYGTNLTMDLVVVIPGVTKFNLYAVTGSSGSFTVPASMSPGTYAMYLAGGSGTSNTYTFTVRTSNTTSSPAPPAITSVSSIGATGGEIFTGENVYVVGTGLTGTDSVKVYGLGGATVVPITSANGTTVTFTAPSLPDGTYTIYLHTPAGTATFSVLMHVRLSPLPTPPTISSINSSSGAAGEVYVGEMATVRGSGLLGATSIAIGGSSARLIPNSAGTSADFTMPNVALGSYAVSLSNSFGVSNLYTVTVKGSSSQAANLPVISYISPNIGGTGTSITFYGTNFSGASSVEFYTTSGRLSGTIVPSSVSISQFVITIPSSFITPDTYQVGVVTNSCSGGCSSNRVSFILTGSATAVPSISLTQTATVANQSADTTKSNGTTGQPFNLKWQSSGATSCTLTKQAPGGSPGQSVPCYEQAADKLNGSCQPTPYVVGTHIFTFTCTNSRGSSALDLWHYVVPGLVSATGGENERAQAASVFDVLQALFGQYHPAF